MKRDSDEHEMQGKRVLRASSLQSGDPANRNLGDEGERLLIGMMKHVQPMSTHVIVPGPKVSPLVILVFQNSVVHCASSGLRGLMDLRGNAFIPVEVMASGTCLGHYQSLKAKGLGQI